MFKFLKSKKTQVPKVLNPFLDVDALRLAHQLMSSANAAPWGDAKEASRPLGRIPGEVLLHALGVALPYSIPVLAHKLANLLADAPLHNVTEVNILFGGLLVGLFASRALHAYIRTKIQAALAAEMAVDQGLYETKRMLSKRTGRPPEEFNLAMLQQMSAVYAKDYLPGLKSQFDREVAKRTTQPQHRKASVAAAAVAGVAAAHAVDYADAPELPLFNTNGMPMLYGPGGFDVLGNSYGQDTTCLGSGDAPSSSGFGSGCSALD